MENFSSFPTAYWAAVRGDEIALVWEKAGSSLFSFLPEKICWRQWHFLLQQAAFLVQQKNVQVDDLVVYSGTHRLAGLICYLATLLCGARILMLNPAMSATQQQAILTEMDVKAVISERDFADFSAQSPACSLPPFYLRKPATLTLTSGSSGKPKAVVHHLQAHLANADGVCELMDFRAENSWLFSLPLYHVSGQGIVWRWLAVGATLWVNETKQGFWQALTQVSHASLVPTQLQRYLTQTDHQSAAGQKMLLGGAFIPSNLIAEARQRGIEVFAGYGMTEMASTVCASRNHLNHLGKPLKNREIQLCGEEIWVRGAGLACGYWQDKRLVPLTNEQGWFATKDKGEWVEGNLVVKGRLDNLFISGGENIQPEQIEAVLLQSELLKQAFVVPIEDVEYGHRPVAYVEFIEPFSVQGVNLLRDFAKAHLEKFKLPLYYFPLENQPNFGIKISRQQLKLDAANRLRELHNV